MSDDAASLADAIDGLDEDQIADFIASLSDDAAEKLVNDLGYRRELTVTPRTPLDQANAMIGGFVDRDHLRYLSNRIAAAVKSVEAGGNPRLIIEMPPRSGKSLLATQVTPAWCLASHPTWPIMITSYSASLATSWSRTIRRWAAAGLLGDVRISDDSAKADEWETTDGGSVLARSVGGQLTGRGAKCLIIDDPHKDFADAHSEASRDAVWNWWLSTASTRLEPSSIVIVILTRWHEDDFAGRLLSKQYAGDPADWEVIRVPAIAEEGDILGREEGEPLLSPLDAAETVETATVRWGKVKRDQGPYVWSALYQQRPTAAQGSIVKVDWFRYWTTDPDLADPPLPDGTRNPNAKTVLVDPAQFAGAAWLDSWDMSFKGGAANDFVVGQRWVRAGANRYLIAQQRDRLDFTEATAAMIAWASSDPATSPYGRYVHKRIVEDAANGPAIISTLRDKISGLKPITARVSKEQRVHAVSPEIFSGNVFLPHPSTPGYSWVTDLISEIREFPNGKHDDQVDALSQALLELRDPGEASIVMPGETTRSSFGSGIVMPGQSTGTVFPNGTPGFL